MRFLHITNTKESEQLKDSDALNYSTLRDLFKAKVKQLGYSTEQFGIHNIRVCGAMVPMYQTTCSNSMAGGGQKMPKTDTSRI